MVTPCFGAGRSRSAGVAVVMPPPGAGERQAVLVASARRQIDEMVRPVQNLESPSVRRIGVEDRTRRVFAKNAQSGRLARGLRGTLLEVVVGGPLREVLVREGHVEVAVEVAAARGDPLEMPAHAALEGGELLQRRAR